MPENDDESSFASGVLQIWSGTQLAGHHLENRPDPARSLQHQKTVFKFLI